MYRKETKRSMADIRKSVVCVYCSAKFSIKYSDELDIPTFCPFCSELYDDPTDIKDEDDDGDLDYSDDERDVLEY